MPNIRRGGGWKLPDPHIPDGFIRVAFCVPDAPEIRQAVVGALTELTHWFNWEKSDPGSGDRRATELTNHMFGPLLESICFGEPMIRQDPSNPCALQYSNDCGETWQTLIDVAACTTSAVSPLLDDQARRILDELEGLYDGSSSSVAPDLTYGDSDDAARDDALCTAWRLMVDTLIEAEAERRAEERDFWAGVAEIMQDAAIAVFGAPVPGARFISLGLALGAAALQGAIAAFSVLDDIVLNDAVARENVACCGFAAMAGATPAESGFQGSLGACGLSGNSEALRQAVHDIINEPNTKLRTYLGFLASWSDMMPLAKQGFLDCPCPVWTLTRLAGDGDANITLPLFGTGQPYYSAARQSIIWQSDGISSSGADMVLDLGGVASVGLCRMRHDDYSGSIGSGSSPRDLYIRLYLGGVLQDEREWFVTDARGWWEHDFGAVDADSIRFRGDIGTGNTSDDRGETTHLYISGDGTPPPNA